MGVEMRIDGRFGGTRIDYAADLKVAVIITKASQKCDRVLRGQHKRRESKVCAQRRSWIQSTRYL